jgi:acyl-CoA synthetase (AMP-forming)/AMP-acid ligase II
MNIGRLIDAAVDTVPERVALAVGDEEVTFAALDDLVDRATTWLARAGVGAGDRVAIVDLASTASVATILAAARLGAASAQMNAYLTPGELAALAELVGARVGVAGPRYAGGLAGAVGGPVLTAAELFAEDHGNDPAHESGEGEDTALVLFTSGTTGLPKPVSISHRVVADRLAYYSRPIDPDAPQVVTMMSAPIFHIGGTLGLLIALHQGRETVLLPKFDAGTWLTLVERHRVTQTFVVPTMLRRILDHPRFASTDLSSLVALSYGAAACPVDLVRRAMAALPGVEFSNTFGQTETLGAYAALTPDDHRRADRLDSVGRPLPGVSVRVLQPESDEEVPAGEVGEFVVRADQNTTTEWLRTGDTGWQDAEGYLFLSGRLSDTINRGGEKFGPIEVEEVLRSHPSVVDAGVVGVPDPDLGERVGAVVVVAEPVDVPALLVHCASMLATYKVPQFVEFADELPVTVLGKPDRRRLLELLDTSSSEAVEP